jgi:hypothetical protein
MAEAITEVVADITVAAIKAVAITVGAMLVVVVIEAVGTDVATAIIHIAVTSGMAFGITTVSGRAGNIRTTTTNISGFADNPELPGQSPKVQLARRVLPPGLACLRGSRTEA